MTAALIVIGVIAYLTAYFAIGWTLAKRDLPHLWNRMRKEWDYDSVARGPVKGGTIATLLFWPIRLPFIKATNIVDTLDPKQIEAEHREQQARIAELERELQIKRRP